MTLTARITFHSATLTVEARHNRLDDAWKLGTVACARTGREVTNDRVRAAALDALLSDEREVCL